VVKAHLTKNNSEDFEDWISRGQNYLGGADCPFCGQATGGLELIEAYRYRFNKAYVDLKRQVAELKSQIESGLADYKIESAVSAAATNAARIEAWKDQLNLTAPALDAAVLGATIKQVREQLLAFAAAKERAPLESVGVQADADAAIAAVALIDVAIKTNNGELRAQTATIADFKKKLATENTATLIADIRKLEAAQKKQLAAVTAAVTEYQNAETERKRLDGEKTKARGQLDAMMQATLQQYQTSINALLTAFGAEFSIEQLKPTYLGGGEPRSEYGLCLRNKSVKLGSRADIATVL